MYQNIRIQWLIVGCSSRRRELESYHPYGTSQPSVTLVSGDLTPLLNSAMHKVHRNMYRQNIHTYKIKSMNLKNKKYENLKVFTHRTSLSLQLYLGIFEYFIYKYFFHVVMSMTKAIIKYCFRNKLNGEIHRCEIRFSSVIFIKNLKNY